MNLIKQLTPPKYRHIICPFCSAHFVAKNVLFRCIIPDCSGREPDIIYAQKWGIAPPQTMGRVLSTNQIPSLLGSPQSIECPFCSGTSRTRICPQCHYELHDVDSLDQRFIAIIGGSNTGKSHYIAVLIEELKAKVGDTFDFSVIQLGDETRLRYERDFFTPLFKRNTVIPATQPAEINPQVKSPLVFRITFENPFFKHFCNGFFNDFFRRALNLYFFDTAGEDMKSSNTMSVQNSYILNAHGIIFLLDPLQIKNVRQQISLPKLPIEDPQAAPDFIVGRLRELFEQSFGLSKTQKIKVPVAFTLSKVDTLDALFDKESPLQKQSIHNGNLDIDNVKSLSVEIESYLKSWLNPNFCNHIKSSFKTYYYFGISSLGTPPNEHDRIIGINPRNVEDPFLWILSRLGYIKCRKGR